MKVFRIILRLLPLYLVVESSRLHLVDETQRAQNKFSGQTAQVSELIKDWNQKNQDRVNDVVILSYGRRSDLFFEVRRAIPEENPVLTPDYGQCSSSNVLKKSREAAFIIIVISVKNLEEVLISEIFLCAD